MATAAATAAAVSGGTAAAAANKIPERPRRPLTAYNLSYRYKRAKIREAKKRGDETGGWLRSLAAHGARLRWRGVRGVRRQ